MNLLVSLAWPNHVHHTYSFDWFGRQGDQPWATTPFTEAGFVRVSSNLSAIASAVPPAQAMEALKQMRKLESHTFLPDDVENVIDEHLAAGKVTTYRQVTDAHLLALAIRHVAKLATFDTGVKALDGKRGNVVLVPTR